MKYAPSVWDFQNGFFLVDRCKEPYFLVSKKGKVLRSNKVGARFLRLRPQLVESLLRQLNEQLIHSTKKAMTLLLEGPRKRVLRAIPIESGDGYLVEIDRV